MAHFCEANRLILSLTGLGGWCVRSRSRALEHQVVNGASYDVVRNTGCHTSDREHGSAIVVGGIGITPGRVGA